MSPSLTQVFRRATLSINNTRVSDPYSVDVVEEKIQLLPNDDTQIWRFASVATQSETTPSRVSDLYSVDVVEEKIQPLPNDETANLEICNRADVVGDYAEHG